MAKTEKIIRVIVQNENRTKNSNFFSKKNCRITFGPVSGPRYTHVLTVFFFLLETCNQSNIYLDNYIK